MITVFAFSCGKKEYDIVFHGRITYKCDGRPVNGLVVNISCVTPHVSYGLGSATTDSDGNYYLRDDGRFEGRYDYFVLNSYGNTVHNQPPFPSPGGDMETSGEHDDDIEMNAAIKYFQQINFHIKNVNPFNSNDLFVWIRHNTDSIHSPYMTGNFPGLVDTIVLTGGKESYPFRYSYQYIKNGDTTTVESSISITACYSIPDIEIFY